MRPFYEPPRSDTPTTTNPLTFSARANGKVNLHLGVGEARADGYHDLATVFMAVDRPETVTITPAWDQTRGNLAPVNDSVSLTRHPDALQKWVTGIHTTFHVEKPDEDLDTPANIAWRAVDMMCNGYTGQLAQDDLDAELPPLRIDVDKSVPVAGGMAGGSADAAAAIAAATTMIAYFGRELPTELFKYYVPGLGADVPFAMMGGVALGTGRGDNLVPMMCRGEYWFAFLNPKVGLSTKDVFEKLDDLRFTYASMVPNMDTTLLSRALVSGDPHQVGAVMHNDLEAAALALRPSLQQIIHSAEDAGAIRAMVSGSGPTIAALCADEAAARGVIDKLTRDGSIEGFAAKGPVGGTTLL